jgi:hypothetical protein
MFCGTSYGEICVYDLKPLLDGSSWTRFVLIAATLFVQSIRRTRYGTLCAILCELCHVLRCVLFVFNAERRDVW